MGNEMFQARFPDDFAERVHKYRKDRHMSKSEAVRHLVRRGLQEEEPDEPDELEEAIANAEPDAQELIADGGYLSRNEHPWVAPLAHMAERSAFFAILLMFLGVVSLSIPGGAIEWFGAELTATGAALALSLFVHLMVPAFALMVVSFVCLGILEYLMHPAEAPIRRYFPRTWPNDGSREVLA